MIDRTVYVDAQHRSLHNDAVIDSLRAALYALELRAAEKRDEDRGFIDRVFQSGTPIEKIETCLTCGHIFCGKHT